MFNLKKLLGIKPKTKNETEKEVKVVSDWRVHFRVHLPHKINLGIIEGQAVVIAENAKSVEETLEESIRDSLKFEIPKYTQAEEKN